MDASTNRREVPLDLARAGEARHFVAWRGTVAGLGRGRLHDLAVAAEAVITDILLSAREGVLGIESEHDEDVFRISIKHSEIAHGREARFRRSAFCGAPGGGLAEGLLDFLLFLS